MWSNAIQICAESLQNAFFEFYNGSLQSGNASSQESFSFIV